jgi:hypothetical protein
MLSSIREKVRYVTPNGGAIWHLKSVTYPKTKNLLLVFFNQV